MINFVFFNTHIHIYIIWPNLFRIGLRTLMAKLCLGHYIAFVRNHFTHLSRMCFFFQRDYPLLQKNSKNWVKLKCARFPKAPINSRTTMVILLPFPMQKSEHQNLEILLGTTQQIAWSRISCVIAIRRGWYGRRNYYVQSSAAVLEHCGGEDHVHRAWLGFYVTWVCM